MSETLLKHSRMPRKYVPGQSVGKPSGSENYGNLRGVDPKDVIKCYLADRLISEIATDYKVSRSALNQYLLRHAEEDWKEAQVARAITRKDAAEEAIDAASDPLALAKARESLKAAQWDLERTCRRIYGEERMQSETITPILNITISSDKPSEQLEGPRSIQVSVAHVRDETHSHVLTQQYDSRAPQQEVITDASSVDNTPK